MPTPNALIIGLVPLFPLAGGAAVARADIDPLTGIDFVTVGHVNNAPWMGAGPGTNNLIGRGSVGYEYRIGKFEVTTAQWAEFMTAAYDRPPSEWLSHLPEPTTWQAARVAGTVPGGRRYVPLAGREMSGVGGVYWRAAAMYCNWLHNGKSTAREAFLRGAYDESTFRIVGGVFTDQLTRSPGAKYFIPTLDEWIKAAHYDPNRYGVGQEGWWHYSHMSDMPAVSGAPGQITPNGPAQASYGVFDGWIIPLGSYPSVLSPWGLLDTAGGMREWLEEAFLSSGSVLYRGFDGSAWDTGSSYDSVWSYSLDLPNSIWSDLGFRVAAAVPSPATGALMLVVGPCSLVRSRRRSCRMSMGTPK